MTLCIFT